MKHQRRIFLHATTAVFAAAMLMPFTAAESAQYPDHPITWIVPYAPGAATDAMARLLAKDLGAKLKQSVVVENQPGAATITAATALKRATPDGYRVMSADITTLVLNPVLRKKLAYDPNKDFTLIGMLAKLPLVLVGRPDLPAKTVTQLLDYAKAHPGKLTYASPGLGSPHHMAMELLDSEAKISMLHVPYAGTGPSMTDLLAGRIDVMFASIGVVGPYLKSGKLKAFGISTDKAFPRLPNVAPLRDEDPRLASFEAYAWQGLIAPAHLPQPVLLKLNHTLQSILANPDVANKLENLGLVPEASTPEEFQEYMHKQAQVWGKIAREQHIQLK